MDYVLQALTYIADLVVHKVAPFVLVLTILVFVHEFGHYWVARRCGVRIDSFSIGFGRRLFGWTDKAGTVWKFCLLPFGGYVKMFDDEDETSWNDNPDTSHLTEEEKKHLFGSKTIAQRAAIVVAGPAINFLFAILIFAVLFSTVGEKFTRPDVGETVPGSVAEKAGFLPGDLFTSIDGRSIKRFEDIQEIIHLHPGDPLTMTFQRNGEEHTVRVTPETVDETDRLGNVEHIGRIGIKHTGDAADIVRQPVGKALVESVRQTWRIVDETMVAIWQMIKGTRSADEMSGVIAIAKLSGDSAHNGAVDLVYFIGLLSINLGLINLFPIPVLDGGHLLFYAIEAVRGKAFGEAVMKYSFRFGLALVLTLAVFANWNDLVHLGFVDFVREHMS